MKNIEPQYKYINDEELKLRILKYYKNEFNTIKELCVSESHFLIFTTDLYLIELIKEELKEYNLLSLDSEKSIKKVYRKLEEKELTIFYSSMVNCIDNQERRNRSRFNHKIVYFPYLNIKTFKELNGLEEDYKIDMSIQSLFKRNLSLKYNLQTTMYMMDLLLPIHFVILSIYGVKYETKDLEIFVIGRLASIKQLFKYNFHSQYVLKKIDELDFMSFFNPLTNRKRMSDVRSYVFENCQLYIKDLFIKYILLYKSLDIFNTRIVYKFSNKILLFPFESFYKFLIITPLRIRIFMNFLYFRNIGIYLQI